MKLSFFTGLGQAGVLTYHRVATVRGELPVSWGFTW
jgi:hypothetical protein